MPPLPDELFGKLEKDVLEAREEAERAADAALNALAVNRAVPYPSLSQEQRRLWDRSAAVALSRQPDTMIATFGALLVFCAVVGPRAPVVSASLACALVLVFVEPEEE